MVRSTEVMEGSDHFRRNREYPSFSSALLEEISRSTESCTVEDEKNNRRRREMKFSRDSNLGVPACKEPHATGQGQAKGQGQGQGQRGIEIGILKYLHGYVDHNRAHKYNDEAAEVEKKKKNRDREQVLLAMQSKSKSNADPSSRRSISSSEAEASAAPDFLVCRRDCKWQWQWHESNVARGHGSAAAASSHGLVMRDALKQTRTSKVKETTKQAMSPGRRLANFLNSLFTGKRKSKRHVTDDHDHCSGSGSGSEKKSCKYNNNKYGEKEKEKEKEKAKAKEEAEAVARQLRNSVSVCSMSSVTSSSNCTSTAATASASTTPNSNSSRLRLHQCEIYKSNLSCNASMKMKRYDEFSLMNQASSCHDHDNDQYPAKQLKSSFVNGNRSRSPKKGIGRSVKFYPTTSVILDEYIGRPCQESKDLNRVENHNKHTLPFPSKSLRRVQLLEKGVIPSEYLIYHQDRKYSNKFVQTQAEDETGDDLGSDSSSDLFELQSLNAVNMDIYSRELPVYETTNLETNRAIAKGLL